MIQMLFIALKIRYKYNCQGFYVNVEYRLGRKHTHAALRITMPYDACAIFIVARYRDRLRRHRVHCTFAVRPLFVFIFVFVFSLAVASIVKMSHIYMKRQTLYGGAHASIFSGNHDGHFSVCDFDSKQQYYDFCFSFAIVDKMHTQNDKTTTTNF